MDPLARDTEFIRYVFERDDSSLEALLDELVSTLSCLRDLLGVTGVCFLEFVLRVTHVDEELGPEPRFVGCREGRHVFSLLISWISWKRLRKVITNMMTTTARTTTQIG